MAGKSINTLKKRIVEFQNDFEEYYGVRPRVIVDWDELFQKLK